MRARHQLIGASLAALALILLGPVAVTSAAMHPFVAPMARPTFLQRPTDAPDPNRNTYTVPEAPRSPACTAHFCVHWVAQGVDAPNLADENGVGDGDGVPDYVERVEGVLEHVYSVENDKLGWRPPKSDGTMGGGHGKTDVYLSEIGGALFGYAAPDRNQATPGHRLPRKLHGYLVLDNDYAPSEFPGTTQLDDLEVTVAHEYNHILQFGYDAFQDAWFAESTAVWMEDQVYPGVRDYLRYMRRWGRAFDTPLTTRSIKEYGSAVWNHWLVHHYGRSIIRSAWARAIHVKPAGFSVAAYDSAIRAAGPSDFSHDFARFSRDVAEWRTDRVFRDGPYYPDLSRQGSLRADGAEQVRHLNHTTYELLRVAPSGNRPLVVDASAPNGIEAALALVGRIGSEQYGRVISRIDFSRHGGKMVLRLPRPSRFQRITAVVINAEASASGFSARRLDWRYADDFAPFTVSAHDGG